MDRPSKSKSDIAIFLLLMGTFIILVYYKSNRDIELINKNRSIQHGLITGIRPVIGGDGLWLQYLFEFHQVQIKSKKRIFIDTGNIETLKELLLNKYVPVVVDSTNYNKNEMPITLQEFERFNMTRPDSLRKLYHVLDSLNKL